MPLSRGSDYPVKNVQDIFAGVGGDNELHLFPVKGISNKQHFTS